jgi:two-component system, LuxR family, sensor kinase FixL
VPRPPVGANYLEMCERAGSLAAESVAHAVRAVLHRQRNRATLEYPTRAGSAEQWFEMAVERFQRPEGGAIVTHVDISRRRRAEAEVRRQRDELAHALRTSTLGALAGSLAHEMNQPLAAIAANAQAARRLLNAEHTDLQELQDALIDITNDAKRAAYVIRRLRALYRKDRPEYTPTDMNALIADVLMLLHGELQARRVAVELALGKDLPPLPCDTIQIQQVILNVVLNAAEAMADHPTGAALLGVETVENHPGTIETLVRDRGPGVKDTDLERIFEPFYTTKTTGLGMGLSISRSIVQAHGGRMWATRNDPHGLIVHIELPYEDNGKR